MPQYLSLRGQRGREEEGSGSELAVRRLEGGEDRVREEKVREK